MASKLGLGDALEILAPPFPRAKQVDVRALVDASFMRRNDDSGFIRALDKKYPVHDRLQPISLT